MSVSVHTLLSWGTFRLFVPCLQSAQAVILSPVFARKIFRTFILSETHRDVSSYLFIQGRFGSFDLGYFSRAFLFRGFEATYCLLYYWITTAVRIIPRCKSWAPCAVILHHDINYNSQNIWFSCGWIKKWILQWILLVPLTTETSASALRIPLGMPDQRLRIGKLIVKSERTGQVAVN